MRHLQVIKSDSWWYNLVGVQIPKRKESWRYVSSYSCPGPRAQEQGSESRGRIFLLRKKQICSLVHPKRRVRSHRSGCSPLLSLPVYISDVTETEEHTRRDVFSTLWALLNPAKLSRKMAQHKLLQWFFFLNFFLYLLPLVLVLNFSLLGFDIYHSVAMVLCFCGCTLR